MISLSVAIMAHPKREAMIPALLDKLDAAEVLVIWDCRENRWDTGRRAMLSYDIRATHHLVIQDDTLICRDLVAGFTQAVKAAPAGVPICGYVGHVRPQAHAIGRAAIRARAVQASFITAHTLNWGPAVLVPTDIILDMIRYCDPLDIPNYDRRMSRYWELERGIRTWYTWPNLVDHADGKSLVAGRIETNRAQRACTRVAYQFIGEDHSALEVDWSGPVVHTEGPLMPQRTTALKSSARAAVWSRNP